VTEVKDSFPEPSQPFIVDATIHAYNLTPENAKSDIARSFLEATYGMVAYTGHKTKMSEADYARDWDIDSLAKLVFVESDVDLAVYHATPLDDYFWDGLTSNEKGIEMHRRWPDRVLFFGGVNGAGRAEDILERARYLVEECGAVGIKLYPERHTDQGPVPVRLDSAACGPLMTWAQENGVPIAIHKVFPAGHGQTDNYRLGDVEAAAALYPGLTIEVVHSGMAFLEETTFLLQRYKNVWANLEVTSAFSVRGTVRFGEALGRLMMSGGADRIVFASGCCLVHPQPIIDAMRAFQIPPELSGYGFPRITDAVMDKIFGLNYARMLNLDVEQLRQKTASDEFTIARRELGVRPEPWATVR
jgi:uncharacterized protein